MPALGSPLAPRAGCSVRPRRVYCQARDSGLSKVQPGCCYLPERRLYYSRRQLPPYGSPNQPRYLCCATGSKAVQQADWPKDFDLPTAVALAGCAFESYLEPCIEDQAMQELAVNGTQAAYTDKNFVLESFAGLLRVEVISASGLPVKNDFLGGDGAYAQVSVGESTGYTETVVLDSNPIFHESFFLYVRDSEKDILKVRLQHQGRRKLASLGVAMFPVKALSDGESHDLQLELHGPGGGGKLVLSARFLKFEESPSEAFFKYDDDDLMSTVGVEGPADLLRDLAGQEQEMKAGPASQDQALMPFQWRALATMVGQKQEDRFTPVSFIDNPGTDTQAWIYRADAQKQAVVAFRGTEQVKWKDFLTDLSVQPKRFNVERTDTVLPLPFGSKEELVHKGFLDAYDSIRMKVFNVVDQITKRDEEWTILVTGHSLGGALATLCAYELATRRQRPSMSDPEVMMYNFGSPRVGNRAFADAYNAAVPKSWLITNSRDVIPTVPRLGGYKHVGNRATLSADGLSFENTPKDLWEGRVMEEVVQEISEKLKQASEDQAAVQEVAERIWANETELIGMVFDGSGIEQHMEEFYLAALRACVTASSQMAEECDQFRHESSQV